MPLDLALFSDKVRRYRAQFEATIEQVAAATGMDREALESLESAAREPTGDEVLILAEYFKCDFKFFISNEKLAPFEQTEKLFRKFGTELSSSDRWAIQEFLFLSENEAFLETALGQRAPPPFRFVKQGNFFKGHGEDAARALREHLGYRAHEVPVDVFADFRKLGVHLFRRELENSSISGLFVKHPTAGKCVLVNYLEDVYRQRFTAAHEAGHAVLDEDEDFVVSFAWERSDLVEVRANAFAANYVLPAEFVRQMPERTWTRESIVDAANRLRVNVDTLLIGLQREKLIDSDTAAAMKGAKVPREMKRDPELPESFTERQRNRKLQLLRRGVSTYYAELCFRAHDADLVSAARVAEMMLCSERELGEIGGLYGSSFARGA